MTIRQKKRSGILHNSTKNHWCIRIIAFFAIFIFTAMTMPHLPNAEAGDIIPEGTIITMKKATKHFGTVERTSPENTTAKDKQCVIDLTAPKQKGHCELGPNDPPAKIVVMGWHDAGNLGNIARDGILYPSDLSVEKRSDLVAQVFLRDFVIVDGQILGPSGKYLEVENTELNPSVGASKSWQNDNVYTLEESSRAMEVALKWAKAWKRYRGDKFGK